MGITDKSRFNTPKATFTIRTSPYIEQLPGYKITPPMFFNFLRITTRNLLKNGAYTAINIVGLAFGIVCSVLILLWVSDELSFDRFHPKVDRLHQLWVNATFDGKINSWRSVPLPTYEEMKVADAQIVNSAVADWGYDHLLKVGEKGLLKKGYYVSEEFLEMFEFPLVSGNAATVLDDPSSIVITESLAKSLFGEEDPLNKVIRVDDESDLQVTGVLKDVPQNSSFQFEFLLPWKYRERINEWVRENRQNWGNYSFQVFVELAENADKDQVEDNIRDILTKKGQDDYPRALFFHPLPDWRLNSNFENGVPTGGMMDYVRLFTLIAVFILGIACINFMNLATARSEGRAKEVGIKKSLGSTRTGLIFQFLGESLFITGISYVLAIGLVLLALPSFNTMVEKELFLDFSSRRFWLFSIPFILVTGIIAGSYPAFFLSSFKPVTTLKGKIAMGRNSGLPRKVLVTLQFGLSIFLLIGAFVIYQQIQLVQNRTLGYDQENLIAIDLNEELSKNYEPLKQELLASGAVEAVTKSNSDVTSINSNNFVGWPGKAPELKVIFTTIVTEYDYAETMGIKVLMGRDFSKNFVNDTSAIIINKAALDLMNLEEPLGTELDLWGEKRRLIGVVDNVLMGSPYVDVKPMFMVMGDWGGVVSVRLKKGMPLTESLAAVRSLFEKHNSTYPFDFRFADVEFQKKFTDIKLTQKLAALFSMLALLITGLGLFGLASYTAERRTKEIGIRKVMGASVSSLVSLLLGEFSRLVIISFFLFAPLAWRLLDNYLDRYQVRVDIAWWIFPLAGLVSLAFAVLIIGNQAYRAARANPIRSLRME